MPLRPRVEQLETRCTPTTAAFSDGVLHVTGTAGAEIIRLTQAAGRITVNGGFNVRVDVCRAVDVDGGAGNDLIDLRGLTVAAAVTAGDGDDLVYGTAADDSL